ncbi:MAG TPA: NTP transferase domain-containing protein, partial [Tepidisphaeraceae bacterium]|nr:NTP transferase domain-containing protein [Tepidisphaeraceae bacterium]
MNNAPETNLTIRGAADVPPRAHVTALILGAGDGLRLGLGPKAFVQLERRTLLERAVAAVRPF